MKWVLGPAGYTTPGFPSRLHLLWLMCHVWYFKWSVLFCCIILLHICGKLFSVKTPHHIILFHPLPLVVKAVPVMASPLPVTLVLVVLLLAESPASQAGDCKGHRQVLRGPPGYVTDGPGNYSVNGNCEWLIKGIVIATILSCAPNVANIQAVNLTGISHLFIYSSSQQQSPHCLKFHLHGHRVYL